MEKEPMGHFVPCVCTIDDMHMPAVSVINSDQRDSQEILIESVRMDFKTDDILKAYHQALKDYEDALSECPMGADMNERIRCVVSSLKKKGYLLTPKTIKNLIFNAASPDAIH